MLNTKQPTSFAMKQRLHANQLWEEAYYQLLLLLLLLMMMMMIIIIISSSSGSITSLELKVSINTVYYTL